MIKIRYATIADLPVIQKLNSMLFEKEYKEYDKSLDLEWPFGKTGEAYFKSRILGKNSCVLVAEQGEIIGYLSGGIVNGENYRKIKKFAEIEHTFILKDYQRKGIGTKMSQTFIDWCKKKKVEIIKVSATAQNKEAIDFYKKNGFKEYVVLLEKNMK